MYGPLKFSLSLDIQVLDFERHKRIQCGDSIITNRFCYVYMKLIDAHFELTET